MMENKHLLWGLLFVLGSLVVITSAQAAITLLSPANYTAWSSNGFSQQKFAFSIDKATGISANCTFFFTPSSVVNGTSDDLTAEKFSFSNMTAINLTVNNGNTTGDYTLGQHYWNISCINNSATAGGVVTTTSVTWIFQYDTTKPTGNNTLPINKSYVNTIPTVFNGTLNDSWSGVDTTSIGIQLRNSSGGSENCLLWLNRSWGNCAATPAGPTTPDWATVNYTLIVNSSNFNTTYRLGKNVTYVFALLSDDKYDLRLYTKDNVTIGTVNTLNLNSTFTLDTTVPGAVIFSVNGLANNSWINSRALRINVTATDSYLNYFNITVNATNSTNISTGAVNDTLYNLSVAADETYTINLTTVDNATNTNSSPTFYVMIDTVIPNATLYSVNGQANNSWFSTRVLRVNITALDTNIKYFNVTVNGTNSTNISTGGVTEILYNISLVNDGTYIINLTVADNATNSNSTAGFYVRVDATVPNSTIFSVNGLTNNSWINSRALRINITASDASINHFNVTINATNSSNISTGGVYDTLYNLSVGSDGTYRINLTTVDNATNINNSPAFYVRVDATLPNSTINNISGKVNNSWFNNRMLAINFTTGDAGIKNWSIYVFNTTDLFNSSPSGWNYTYYESNTSAEVNFSAPRDGTYWFNLTTVDNASNVNTTVLFYARVDATNPSVGTPSFSGISSSGATISVEIGESNLNSCTYSGGSSGTLSCSGTTCSSALSGLSASTIYSYSVTCTDLAGNTANSGSSNSFITSSASSGSGSGGSGGGSSSGVAGQFTKKVWSSLYAGDTATISVKEGDGIGVTEVNFKVDKTSYGVIGDVKKVEKTEVPAEIAGKKVHNYMKIMITGAIKEENTKERTVLFKIAKKWLVDNSVSKDKLALYRYADSKWNTLPTKLTKEDETTIYYSAETPGFSYFAIAESEVAAEAPAPVKEELPTAEAPAEEVPEASEAPVEAEAPTAEEKTSTWLWVVLIVVIAAIIAAVYFWPKKNKRGF